MEEVIRGGGRGLRGVIFGLGGVKLRGHIQHGGLATLRLWSWCDGGKGVKLRKRLKKEEVVGV